jgi:hypothetical protein
VTDEQRYTLTASMESEGYAETITRRDLTAVEAADLREDLRRSAPPGSTMTCEILPQED